ncbi:MAG: alpha/beta hydrolase [Flavobacteriales bacterium]
MSKKNNLIVEKTATYYTLGDVNTAKTIWFVLHGYGYLAEFFIKKFEPIVNNKTCVIAPEALSKFYLNGFYGRVGASWMTKQDRENEIIDYVKYLNQLYHLLVSNQNKNVKINVVGFSQGGSTACRWIADGKIKVDNFILWSTVFPDDMNFEKILNNSKLFLIYGTNDEFLTPEKISTLEQQITTDAINCKVISFDGPHDIPKEVLLEETMKNDWV